MEFRSDSNQYKTIIEKKSARYSEVEKAFELTRQFIIEHQRILYGGMALHMALIAAKSSGIYQPDALPDYDFYSPDFYVDSNKLADRLHQAGFPNVSAINAAHFNSRRVRVNFAPVADITFIPKNIFDRIPILIDLVDGLRYVHPDFARLDIHRAFNIPYNNPPQEVIAHRLAKDQKRFRLLDQFYPIIAPKTSMKYRRVRFHWAELTDKVITGWLGYALMLALARTFTKSKIEPEQPVATITDQYLEADIPVDLPVTFVVLRFEAGKKAIYKNAFLELRPPSQTSAKIELFELRGELLPCYEINSAVSRLMPNHAEVTGFLSQPNHLLLYFLQQSIEFPNLADIHRQAYCSVLRIIEQTEEYYLANRDKWVEHYEQLPFFMPAKTFGDCNCSADANAIIMEQRTGESLRPVFGYYPANNRAAPSFDIMDNPLLQIDGAEKRKKSEY